MKDFYGSACGIVHNQPAVNGKCRSKEAFAHKAPEKKMNKGNPAFI